MVKALSTEINRQIGNKAVAFTTTFTINSTDYTSYLLSNWTISTDRKFGAMSATFRLNNDDSRFSTDGSDELEVGDVVSLTTNFTGDPTSFTKFYGIIKSRNVEKRSNSKFINLVCLDYISVLQDLDIDTQVEGTRVKVTNEVLEPNFLPDPNGNMAQLFNFANNGLATFPIPTIRFRDQNHTASIDTQYDGFEVYYDVGQLKLGSPLNVADNFEVLATYYYYVDGVYIEDIIETLLTTADGYGKFLFGATSASQVINDHLSDTLLNVTDRSADDMVPNLVTETIKIKTTLASAVSENSNNVILDDASGFPTSGTGSINGDVFNWGGKSGNTLTGIPTAGSNGVGDHNVGDIVEYETTYSSGKVWYLAYDNLLTTLVSGDFSGLGGASIDYIDKRFGRILLDTAISIASNVQCNTNYTFKTLQATGIQVNRITFRKREVANRFDALKKVRQYVAPNYIIATKGDQRIWAEYLNQKTTEDYTLALESTLSYMEDTDLFTRVVMWGKNRNPTNIMFGDDVDYTSDDEESYTGISSLDELFYFGEEKSGILSATASALLSEAELLHSSETEQLINHIKKIAIDKDNPSQASTGAHVFGTSISGRGKIILGDIVPTVLINDVPINNTIAQQTAVPIKIKSTSQTITEGGGKSKSVSVVTYYYYTVIFPHASIVPNEPISLFDSQGILRFTITPNDPNMNYSTGIWTIPGIERNDVAEVLSTATYKVLYSASNLSIDYDNILFKINNKILPNPEEIVVRATYEYWAIVVEIRDIQHLVDGRRDTQLQLEFFGEPPSGFHLATIDLGASFNIQAIDVVGGFFKPDDLRRFDVGFKMSMQSSTDNITFTSISDKTEGFEVTTGEAISFEEEDLGTGFTTRYLKFSLDSVDRINFGRGRYVVALTEISAYKDIIIESEIKLIPTTTLSASVSDSDTTITVVSTSGFTTPVSGEDAPTAYIAGNDSFTYSGVTATTFTGVTVESGGSGSSGDRVSQTIEADTTLYDDDGLFPNLGDRVTHIQQISDRNLFSQSELDVLAKSFLKEFYKNHSKIKANVVYAPYLEIGQTVLLVDAYNAINARYFIESMRHNESAYQLVLAKYPAT